MKYKNSHLPGAQIDPKLKRKVDQLKIDITDEEFIYEFGDDAEAYIIDESDVGIKNLQYRKAMWPSINAHSLVTDPASFYVNNVVFSGILYTNPVFRILQIENSTGQVSKKPMVEFNMAQKTRYYSKHENVYFNRYTTMGVRAFGDTAIMIKNLMFKGNFLQVIGQLSTRHWTKQNTDGTKSRQSKTIILATQVQMWQPSIKKLGVTTELSPELTKEI